MPINTKFSLPLLAKKKHSKRVLTPRFPMNIERRYKALLASKVGILNGIVKKNVVQNLSELLLLANEDKPRTDTIRNDDGFARKVAEYLLKSQIEFDDQFANWEMEDLAMQIGQQVSEFNRKDVTRILSAFTAVDVILHEPYLQSIMEAFVASNVGLIKSIPQQYFQKLESMVYGGARQGFRSTELAKQIQNLYEVTSRRARLIARDQVSKFNGQLSQVRQQSVGVQNYVWVTVGDERVRGRPDGRYPKAKPSHWEREGKVFSWAKPPKGGHPGEAIQCRCVAKPKLSEVL